MLFIFLIFFTNVPLPMLEGDRGAPADDNFICFLNELYLPDQFKVKYSRHLFAVKGVDIPSFIKSPLATPHKCTEIIYIYIYIYIYGGDTYLWIQLISQN